VGSACDAAGVTAPSGTVTFLFTDIEGSTRLWQADETAMRSALSRHDQLLRQTVADHDGVVFSSMGDGIAAAFPSASAAAVAALTSQRLLDTEVWPTVMPIRVRMGLHTGEAEMRDGDYFGTAVYRAARLMAVGHGGQVLCSAATASLVESETPLLDLGEHRLRDLDRPLRVFQLGGGAFPRLRSLDAFPGNLPAQLTSFVGRHRELAVIAEALGHARLLTLTGTGGWARPVWPFRRQPTIFRPSRMAPGFASWPRRRIRTRCARWWRPAWGSVPDKVWPWPRGSPSTSARGVCSSC
jgi:class 3 adenylate cyclase